MKILTLNYEFPPVGGGGGRVSYELCRELVRQGHTVDVVTMHYGELPREETREGIRIYRTPAVRRRSHICHTHEMVSYIAGAMGTCRTMLRDGRYDLVHCHFLIPTGILAAMVCRKAGIPFVITAHGSDVPGHNPDRFTLLHRFTGPVLRWIVGRAGAVVSPSEFLRGQMIRTLGDVDIQQIPNGIDLKSHEMTGRVPKANRILSTGRLMEKKGFQTLIRAVRDRELPLEVHIAGEGDYRPVLEKLAEGSKTRIFFHGWLDKESDFYKDLYAGSSIYFLGSSIENASISLLEGMAAKCVVITTKSAGCPETVGDAGFLIDYDDADALRKILIRLAGDPELCREYGEKAYQRVNDHFLWEGIARRYIEVFERALKSR